MTAPRRVSCPSDKAEGQIILPGCAPIPYDTWIAGPGGCGIHLWMGDAVGNGDRIELALRLARAHRDVVQVTYSDGEPGGYWARVDMRP